MREYEFTLIARSDLPEAERAKVFTKYEELVTSNGGEVLKKEDWGVKKLAFPMKKQFRGHYMFFDFVQTEAEHLKEAERLMRIDDDVLRYLLIRTGERVDPAARKEELAKEVANEGSRESRN